MKAFLPYSGSARCVCFTETTPEHLRYLLNERHYLPYGIVLTRGQVLARGGGTVAYVHDAGTLAKFDKANLGHWAVRTGGDADWTYEREWRIPWPAPKLSLKDGVRAILVPTTYWRPVPPGQELPELWVKSRIWVWNPREGKVAEYSPGELV